jgi:acyl-coenzyme A thioesterase PaaI-like protein
MAEPEPIALPWRHLPGYNCGNPAGLQLRFTRESDHEISSRFTLGRAHESYPNVVHGGIAATVLDEIMGNALSLCRLRLCFTLALRTRFIEPLRTDRIYQARARVGPAPGELAVFRVESEITDLEGTVMVTGTGTYRTISVEQARSEIGEGPAAWATDEGYLATNHIDPLKGGDE